MRVADLHCDTVERLAGGADLAQHNPDGHIDIPRLRSGEVGLQAFAAYISPQTPEAEAFAATASLLDQIERVCRENPDALSLVADAPTAEAVAADGRTGVLLTVENGHAIEESIDNLESLRQRGVRSMAIVHSKNTAWAASCSEDSCSFDGLSVFGETVVEAMNDMGMIVDVSHCHDTAFWKVARICRRMRKPFIASHSNAWAICSMPRNLKDDQIREIADQGGVIGINFFPSFLDQTYHTVSKTRSQEMLETMAGIENQHEGDPTGKARAIEELRRSYREKMSDTPVTSDSILNHLQHMVDLVGVDHVGFGSDFDGIPTTPTDVTGSDAYPMILDRLSGMGFSQADLEKIAWGNVMRVLKAHE